MAIIGTFVKSGDTYVGTVNTLAFNFKAKLTPSEGGSDQAPDFRVYSGEAEIGAGWKRTSAEKREFVSLKLDDPSFGQPVYASLFQVDDTDSYNLIWSRAKSN